MKEWQKNLMGIIACLICFVILLFMAAFLRKLSVLSTTLLFFIANEIRKERVRQRRITLR